MYILIVECTYPALSYSYCAYSYCRMYVPNLKLFILCIFLHTDEGDQWLNWRVGLVLLYCNKLPVDGSPVPKHVGFDTCHELCFIICVLLYFIECVWWMYVPSFVIGTFCWEMSKLTVQHIPNFFEGMGGIYRAVQGNEVMSWFQLMCFIRLLRSCDEFVIAFNVETAIPADGWLWVRLVEWQLTVANRSTLGLHCQCGTLSSTDPPHGMPRALNWDLGDRKPVTDSPSREILLLESACHRVWAHRLTSLFWLMPLVTFKLDGTKRTGLGWRPAAKFRHPKVWMFASPK